MKQEVKVLLHLYTHLHTHRNSLYMRVCVDYVQDAKTARDEGCIYTNF